jgi:hypothetical protein
MECVLTRLLLIPWKWSRYILIPISVPTCNFEWNAHKTCDCLYQDFGIYGMLLKLKNVRFSQPFFWIFRSSWMLYMTTGKHLLTFRRIVIWDSLPSKVKALRSFETGVNCYILREVCYPFGQCRLNSRSTKLEFLIIHVACDNEIMTKICYRGHWLLIFSALNAPSFRCPHSSFHPCVCCNIHFVTVLRKYRRVFFAIQVTYKLLCKYLNMLFSTSTPIDTGRTEYRGVQCVLHVQV